RTHARAPRPGVHGPQLLGKRAARGATGTSCVGGGDAATPARLNPASHPKRDRVEERDRREAIVVQSSAGRVTSARRGVTAVRRRACVLVALAATAAFGLTLGGRAAAQVDPTTPSSLADTCAPTEGPPTPTPSPT